MREDKKMSLKDALLKAGLKATVAPNDRENKKPKHKKAIEKHQEQRNYCEVCEFIQPDVEHFKHRVPTIDARWICCNCADKNEILDDFRTTAQSDFSIQKKYRRYYGHTQDPRNFKTGTVTRTDKPDKKKNFNR